jgi:glycosyltransferase involved in cell wall biosynthesis
MIDGPTMKNEPQVLINVVIPCYRCTETIARAVESVWAQTLRPAQVVLVEDGSGDGTLDELQRLKKHYPDDWVKLIPLEKNGGVSNARNTGWDASPSRYTAFLDADESWHPSKIEIQCGWMESHQHVWLSGHAIEKDVSPSGLASSAIDKNAIRAVAVSKEKLLASNRFVTSSVMVRNGLPFRFDKEKRRSEDYLLWLQYCLSGHDTAVLEHKLAYRYKADFGAGGLSGNLWAMQKDEIDTYIKIFNEKKIGAVQCFVYSCYSTLKFVRRGMIARVASRF